MSENAPFPRVFGAYRLTEELGRDALGRVFRALRLSGERGFVRLRIFESAEISEDAVLDAIEESGEIHTFLKNPAIARGVQVDAVDGIPFLAWSEPNGRTLDTVIARALEQQRGIPIEHALLIAEKVATALDHAYNTTVDGERTLHGLVWPGFVSISDDGETRLAGFGLAPGFFPSISQPHFAREIAPYLAPEERALLSIAKNSDVYSVGALLFHLLLGRLPSTDPLADVKTASSLAGGPIPPETVAVLRTCLSPAESRYQSSGDLRRELGKILFSGPYAPSTFNLAFFITSLFSAEIEAENRARVRESALDSMAVAETPSAAPPTIQKAGGGARQPPAPRRPYAIGGALLVAAAVASTVYMITAKPSRQARPSSPARSSLTATPAPILKPSSPPTAAMSDAQFKDQVAQRVATELKRVEDVLQRSRAAAARKTARAAQSARVEAAVEPAPEPTTANPSAPEPTATHATVTVPTVPPPLQVAPRAAPSESETPPKIERIVKPTYPALALRAGIKGVVVLRVLVSETGQPEQVEVTRGVAGGLTEAAVSAVRKWTFEPGRRNGQPVPWWTTIPIPFEP